MENDNQNYEVAVSLERLALYALESLIGAFELTLGENEDGAFVLSSSNEAMMDHVRRLLK